MDSKYKVNYYLRGKSAAADQFYDFQILKKINKS